MKTNSFISRTGKSENQQIQKAISLKKKLKSVDSKIPTLLKKQFNFKGRKDPNIGKIIISELSNINDTIFDPFIGSGSYMVSACSADRKFIGSELDNYTFDVVKNFFQECDLYNLEKHFNKIKEESFTQINELYKTKCCNQINYIQKLHFDPKDINYYTPKKHRDISNDENIKLVYKCPVCNKKSKKFDQFDEIQLKKIDQFDTSAFPNHILIENSRINITKSSGSNKFDRNFTKRNKLALLYLQRAISNIPYDHEQHLLQHFLVSSLTLSRIAQYGSGSEYIYQVILEKAQDMNVWNLFEQKYFHFLKFYKEFILPNKSWYENNKALYNQDYQTLVNYMMNNNQKINLILTDPPYYDQVPYLERNQLYRDWLSKFVSERYNLDNKMLNNEIVVSNAPSRKEKKNYDNHLKDIVKMFEHFSKVIKENGFVVLAVNLGQKKYFDLLSHYILSARKNGFEYITRIDKKNSDPTLRKQVAYSSTLSKDMYLIFNKLKKDKEYWFKEDLNVEFSLKKFTFEEIISNDNPIKLSDIITKFERIKLHEVTSANSEQQARIAKIIKGNFKLDNKLNVYLDENKLYMDLEDSDSLFIKLYDLIPMIIEKLFKEQNDCFTLEDIYFELSDKLCDGEPNLLNKILNSKNKESEIYNLILNYSFETQKGFTRLKPKTNTNGKSMVDLRTVDPYEFEDIIKELLIKEGFKNVYRMGGAGDRGVDIIAQKKDIYTNDEKRYLFQCKRWIGNVGSEPIQRLHSVQITDHFDYAECITTSDYTEQGMHEAVLTNIKTTNGHNLINRLEKHIPNTYYIGAITKKKH